AVEGLREGGHEGRITLVGAETHLPYDRPPLSKQLLAGAWESDRLTYRDGDAMSALNVTTMLGRRAVSLDLQNRTVGLDTGEPLSFDGLVIATGASPRTLPGTPALPGIYTLRTLDDALALRAEFERGPRVAVVGAGFIGAEVAATARERGLDVTLIEAFPVPLVRAIGEEMGRICATLHFDHGVDVRLGVGVEAFGGTGRLERVLLSDGTAVEADVAIVGIGVMPNTQWLESSGLELRDGVVCDAYCQAGAPGVYAAGDVARWYNPLFEEEMRVEHWTNAAEQGRAAALNLLAGAEKSTEYSPVPYFWSDQYGLTLQFVGHHGPGDEVEVVHGSPDERKFVALYRRGDRLVGAFGMAWSRIVMRYSSLIAKRATWDEALAFAKTLG
ncbi:MAG TPA: FAD-dependent oxidoreductase, partial [Dehalococcoidia bacterium]|nr:FAD-dependent oxidoreductase [Dehalococcoidia bacterium]